MDFTRYNTKCRGENETLRGIFRVISRFLLHFVLYHGNSDYFFGPCVAPPPYRNLSCYRRRVLRTSAASTTTPSSTAWRPWQPSTGWTPTTRAPTSCKRQLVPRPGASNKQNLPVTWNKRELLSASGAIWAENHWRNYTHAQWATYTQENRLVLRYEMCCTCHVCQLFLWHVYPLLCGTFALWHVCVCVCVPSNMWFVRYVFFPVPHVNLWPVPHWHLFFVYHIVTCGSYSCHVSIVSRFKSGACFVAQLCCVCCHLLLIPSIFQWLERREWKEIYC